MTHVDTGAALGLLGFELDLTDCDHFEDKNTLKYVGRVSVAKKTWPWQWPWPKIDQTCDKVCVSVTGGA
jgi:hypothetical protein